MLQLSLLQLVPKLQLIFTTSHICHHSRLSPPLAHLSAGLVCLAREKQNPFREGSGNDKWWWPGESLSSRHIFPCLNDAAAILFPHNICLTYFHQYSSSTLFSDLPAWEAPGGSQNVCSSRTAAKSLRRSVSVVKESLKLQGQGLRPLFCFQDLCALTETEHLISASSKGFHGQHGQRGNTAKAQAEKNRYFKRNKAWA